uniref:Uncharacterized protein n=1 Tax=Romanomermis culicivorax TaxID=13658 RepID=A0A915J4S1_ROMCU
MSAFFVVFFVYFLFKKYIPNKTEIKLTDVRDQNGLDQLSMDAEDDDKYLADENDACDHCGANGHSGERENQEEEEEEEEDEEVDQNQLKKRAQVGIREVTVEKVGQPTVPDRRPLATKTYSEEEKLLAKQRITKIIGQKL